MEILLGKTNGSDLKIWTASDADNGHILETGRSRSGKTYAMQILEERIANEGGCVVVLDYNGTHSNVRKSGQIQRIEIYKKGLPFLLLTPLTLLDGSFEREMDIMEAVVDVFHTVAPLQSKQRMALREAVLMAITDKSGKEKDEFRRIMAALKELEDSSAESVLDKFFPIFSGVRVWSQNRFSLEKGKIQLFDLNGYSPYVQRLLAELIIAVIWRWRRVKRDGADCPVYIVCDEFQLLSLKRDSVLSQILREGRKFHVSLLLATQTLETFDRGEKAMLQQAATHLYFRPAEGEIKSIIRYLGAEDTEGTKKILQSLACGESLASGRLRVGNITVEKHLKIKF